VCLSLLELPERPGKVPRLSGGGSPMFLAFGALASDPLVSGGSPEGFSPLVCIRVGAYVSRTIFGSEDVS
jgi:hypothetical protein